MKWNLAWFSDSVPYITMKNSLLVYNGNQIHIVSYFLLQKEKSEYFFHQPRKCSCEGKWDKHDRSRRTSSDWCFKELLPGWVLK